MRLLLGLVVIAVLFALSPVHQESPTGRSGSAMSGLLPPDVASATLAAGLLAAEVERHRRNAAAAIVPTVPLPPRQPGPGRL